MATKEGYIAVGQEVRVPAKFGDAVVEVLGITPGSVLVDLLGTGASVIAVPAKEVRDLEGRPARSSEGLRGRTPR